MKDKGIETPIRYSHLLNLAMIIVAGLVLWGAANYWFFYPDCKSIVLERITVKYNGSSASVLCDGNTILMSFKLITATSLRPTP